MPDPELKDLLNDLEINVEINTESNQSSEDSTQPSPEQGIDPLSQVSDAVTQTNVSVVGESPSMAEAELHQILSHSTSITVQNAVNMQKQLTETHQATTTKKIRDFLSPHLKKKPRTAFEKSLKRLMDMMQVIEGMKF